MQRSSAVLIVLAALAGLVLAWAATPSFTPRAIPISPTIPLPAPIVMSCRRQYDAWVKSSHHSAATCNDCHTPHNFIGKYAVKANNGFWHSFYFTSGKYPDTIEITKFDHKVTENACRRCHENITSAIDGNMVHGNAEGLQCTRCHSSVGHSEAAASADTPASHGVIMTSSTN